MIQVYEAKELCCGCTACKHICPSSAIEMIADEEGFLYPVINQVLCIDCGLCKMVCPFQNKQDTSRNLDIPQVYAAKHIDEEVRMNSTSGGVFTAVSDYVLKKEGIIYGVVLDKDMNVVHKMARNYAERDSIRGSKYVQSDLKSVYKEIKKLLKEGEFILFTGTPCQNAGLTNFLSKTNQENLILCDIVCHGTPSPLMWKEHVNHIENKKNKIKRYYFRDKIEGWHKHTEMVIYLNGEKDYKSVLIQKHKVLFYSHNILRPSCHNCPYTNLQRTSDITIADFWGIENHMADFDDNKGVSLILLNTIVFVN